MTTPENPPKIEEPSRRSPFEIALQQRREIGPLRSDVAFWLLAWLGTAFAGSFYGLAFLILAAFTELSPGALVLFFVPMIVGFIVAGFWAVPCVLTVAAVTWGLWLSRVRTIAAAIAGGWTGVVAARALFGSDSFFSPPGFGVNPVFLAGIFGVVGCPLFTHLMGRRIFARYKKKEDAKGPWQFTLRDLFIHFTVLAVVISFWTSYFASVRNAESRDQPATAVPMTGPQTLPAES